MQKLFLSITLVLFVSIAFAQTSLTIIGTQHDPTPHFNSDSIYNVLLKIKPDVILQELDASLMDDEGNYIGYGATMGGNEKLASLRYRSVNPNVIFRRFDIEDRNHYYQVNNTMAMEGKVGKSMDSLYRIGALSQDNLVLRQAFGQVNYRLHQLDQSDIYGLNDENYMTIAEERQRVMYSNLLQIVSSTPQLKKYTDFQKEDGDFWVRRNERMIHNISEYIKQFPGKKIVILTGSFHKYYLTNGLKPMQSKLHFKLKDLPR